jgi:hypothetical protein
MYKKVQTISVTLTTIFNVTAMPKDQIHPEGPSSATKAS